MKGVIFDFNGTLFLDNDKHVLAWNRISQELRNTDITEEELHEKMNGRPNKLIIRYLNGGVEDSALEDKYSLLKEEYYREFCQADTENFHLIKGAEELFDDLTAQGVPFTIASASIKPNIDFFVKNFHLDRWMDPDSIVYDDGTYENKVAMFGKAAENLGMSLEELTVIEDSLAGIDSSVRAGIRDIRLLDSGHIQDQVRDLSQITQVVQDMTEIKR
ncbi:HAD family hydrolase [Faecalibaculum rodentium]|uniref:HAD family hydrolase n=1 Tax=Faecalibaculum rodentium TaxID=1702221 RepID=UPI00255AB89E|nr:HAD family phosphatase [Faecalibaculum rodentium]